MSMSKQDFIALADAIKDHNAMAGNNSLAQLGSELNSPFNPAHLNVIAIFCKRQNSAFNRDRWFDYIAGECGPSGGKVKKDVGKKAFEHGPVAL